MSEFTRLESPRTHMMRPQKTPVLKQNWLEDKEMSMHSRVRWLALGFAGFMYVQSPCSRVSCYTMCPGRPSFHTQRFHPLSGFRILISIGSVVSSVHKVLSLG